MSLWEVQIHRKQTPGTREVQLVVRQPPITQCLQAACQESRQEEKPQLPGVAQCSIHNATRWHPSFLPNHLNHMLMTFKLPGPARSFENTAIHYVS